MNVLYSSGAPEHYTISVGLTIAAAAKARNRNIERCCRRCTRPNQRRLSIGSDPKPGRVDPVVQRALVVVSGVRSHMEQNVTRVRGRPDQVPAVPSGRGTHFSKRPLGLSGRPEQPRENMSDRLMKCQTCCGLAGANRHWAQGRIMLDRAVLKNGFRVRFGSQITWRWHDRPRTGRLSVHAGPGRTGSRPARRRGGRLEIE